MYKDVKMITSGSSDVKYNTYHPLHTYCILIRDDDYKGKYLLHDFYWQLSYDYP